MNKENDIIKMLYAAADAAYRDFNSSLIPTIDRDKFIGVRTPILRKIAKDIIKLGLANDFMSMLPHKYFEENQLHAFIISDMKDFNMAIDSVSRFLPYIDNWATCDQMSPRVFKKNPELLFKHIQKWIKSNDVYAVRFGVLCLMRYFLDDNFDVKYADMVAKIQSDEYYINMMRAWYFATAMIKHFDVILQYVRGNKIDDWTRRRTIQKALESYRIDTSHKEILRDLR